MPEPACTAALAAPAVKGSVLLVDDDRLVLNAYGRVLRQAGFDVTQLSDGRLVPSELVKKEFDLVVTDIILQGLSGIDVLRASHAHDPDLPVVLMTAGRDLESAMKAVEHGAMRYLLKPVAPLLLLEAARSAVDSRRIAKVKRRALELHGGAADKLSGLAALAGRFDQALASLHVVFQPIVRCSTRQVFAYEALLRAREGGFHGPGALLAAAEQLERVHEVGRLVRRQVANAVRDGAPPAQIFVNLHPQDLNDDELLAPEAPLSLIAGGVVLELTERASLEGVDVRVQLATLRRLGFRIALDDLGAGYAGLSSFAQLRPEVVKLDMSLIRGIDQERTKQRLVETMKGLCDELGVLVIAEGVETSRERDTLIALGCDLLQGYLFAKPAAGFPVVDWHSGCDTARRPANSRCPQEKIFRLVADEPFATHLVDAGPDQGPAPGRDLNGSQNPNR